MSGIIHPQLENRLQNILSRTRATSTNGGWSGHCPCSVHKNHDANPSLSIWIDNDGAIGLKCLAGGNYESIVSALGFQKHELFPPKPKKEKKNAERKFAAGTITLSDLAKAKNIPIQHLESLGLESRSNKYFGKHVSIPYYDTDGNRILERVRLHLKAPEGECHTRARAGEQQTVYGLQKINEYRNHGVLIIGEGESDFWTLSYYGFPVITVPGAAQFSKLEHSHIQGIDRIYAINEGDSAGGKFILGLSQRLPRIGFRGKLQEINLKEKYGVKDPSDLHLKLNPDLSTPDTFRQAFNQAMDKAKPVDLSKFDRRFEIRLDMSLRQLTDLTIKQLVINNNPAQLFVRNGFLTRVRMDENDHPICETVNTKTIRNISTRFIDYVKETNGCIRPEIPPNALFENILVEPEYPQFPPLKGISEIPVIRENGSIHNRFGYDPESKIYYHQAGELKKVEIQENPTLSQIEEAKKIIWDVFNDFPFVDESSKANCFAACITPFVRNLVPNVPILLFDSPRGGNGKSLLTDIVSIIATGDTANAISLSNSDNELRKKLTSLLINGTKIITFDNIESTLYQPSLESFVTASNWSDRLLGQNQEIRVKNQSLVMVTGNNIQLKRALPRRCYLVRIDARTDNPDERTGFKHENLRSHVKENRAKIVSAILTLIRAWFVSGQVNPDVKPMGSFEEWTKIVGGILKNAGIHGFLENRKDIKERSDTESPVLAAFFEMWYSIFGDRPVTVRELTGEIENCEELRNTIPPELLSSLISKSGDFQRKLGNLLKKKRDVQFGVYRLESVGFDSHTKVLLWSMKKYSAGSAESAGSDSNPYAWENPIYSNNTDDMFSVTEKDGVLNIWGRDSTPHVPLTPQIVDTEIHPSVRDTRLPLHLKKAFPKDIDRLIRSGMNEQAAVEQRVSELRAEYSKCFNGAPSSAQQRDSV